MCLASSVKMLGEVRDPKESSFPACTENITVTHHLFALVRLFFFLKSYFIVFTPSSIDALKMINAALTVTDI